MSLGLVNFNDDLNVFVPVASNSYGNDGTSTPYYGHTPTNVAPGQYRPRPSIGSAAHSKHPGIAPPPPIAQYYDLRTQNTLFGVCPSDIDKYSRVVFPVCFLCFNLMYWIIYMHISEFLVDDQGTTAMETVP